MRNILAIVCITLLAGSKIFGGDFVIELKKEKMNVQTKDFYIAGVIDARYDKSCIGHAMLGIFNRRSEVKFAKETAQEIFDFINYTIPKDTLKTPIYIKILALNVDEDTRFTGEYATVNITLAFLKKDGDLYAEAARTVNRLEQSSLYDVTDFHEENIRNALELCLREFETKYAPDTLLEYQKLEASEPDSMYVKDSVFAALAGPLSHKAFTISGLFCKNSSGADILLITYPNKGNSWVFPISYSMSIITINPTEEFSRSIGYNFGFAFGALKPIDDNFKIFLNGKIPFGTERITYYDGDKSSFYIGFEATQSLIITPGGSSIGVSVGLIESVLSGSKLHPRDIGFRIGIGSGF